VSGTAGKFNIIPLMLTIGAGIGLMSKIKPTSFLEFTQIEKTKF